MRAKNSRTCMWIPAALASLVLSLTACSRKAASETEEPAVAEVTLTQIKRAEVSQVLNLTGTIAALPNQDVRVSSLVPGRVAEMKAAEGDRVRAGQLVAQIDDRPIRDQLAQAEAAAAQARANLANATLARARNENLFERGIAARKDLEDARTQESVAAAALQEAEAAPDSHPHRQPERFAAPGNVPERAGAHRDSRRCAGRAATGCLSR